MSKILSSKIPSFCGIRGTASIAKGVLYKLLIKIYFVLDQTPYSKTFGATYPAFCRKVTVGLRTTLGLKGGCRGCHETRILGRTSQAAVQLGHEAKFWTTVLLRSLRCRVSVQHLGDHALQVRRFRNVEQNGVVLGGTAFLQYADDVPSIGGG